MTRSALVAQRAKAAVAGTCLWLNVVCAAPFATAADLAWNGFTYSITNNEVTILAWQSEANALTIPDEIEGKPVRTIGPKAFTDKRKLERVTIPDTVRQIEEEAFHNCALTHAVLGKSVTNIGHLAFAYCLRLQDVGFPEGLTSIGYAAFRECHSFTNVVLPASLRTLGAEAFQATGMETLSIPYGVTNIGKSAFAGCRKLMTVTIPGSVAHIDDETFSACEALRTVKLSDSVISLGEHAFYACSGLEDITFGASVQRVGNAAFAGNRSLRSIRLPDSLTEVPASAFQGCVELTNVVFGSCVRKIGRWAFRDCSELREIQFPNTVEAIDEMAFDSCRNLRRVALPASMKRNVPFAFTCCGALSEFVVADDHSDFRSAQGVLFNRDMTTLLWYPPGREGGEYRVPDGVTTIGVRAFAGASILATVVLPASVTNIAAAAFCQMTNLLNVTLPDSVTVMGDFVFQECTSLTNVASLGRVRSLPRDAFMGCRDLSQVILPASLTNIGRRAFLSCSGLREVEIPNGVIEFGPRTFSYCSSLRRVVIPERCETIGVNAFDNCIALSELLVADGNRLFRSAESVLFNSDMTALIRYPPGRKAAEYRIPDGVTRLGPHSFDGVAALRDVVFPASLTNVGEGAFLGATNLASLALPSRVTVLGEEAFTGCTALTNVTSLGRVESLGRHAFSGCVNLRQVILPASLTNIGLQAFSPSGLQTVSIPAGVRRIDNGAFDSCEQLKTAWFEADAPCMDYSSVFNLRGLTTYYKENAKGWTNETVRDQKVFGISAQGHWIFSIQAGRTVSIISYRDREATVKIPASFAGRLVTTIGDNAFASNSALLTVIIPAGVTGLATRAFAECPNLERVFFEGDAPAAERDIVEETAYDRRPPLTFKKPGSEAVFENTPAIIYCRADTKGWASRYAGRPVSVYSLYDHGVAAVTDADGRMTLLRYLGADRAVVVPAELDGKPVTAIGPKAFAGCRELTEVTIPSSVRRIGEQAFEGCYRLAAVNGAAHVADVGAAAFDSCYRLTNTVVAGRLRGGDAAAEDAAAGGLSLRLRLANGDVITGTNAMRSIALRTADSVLIVPLAHLAAIRPEKGDEADAIRLRNGDIIKGKINLHQIELKGLIPAVTINTRHVLEVEVLLAEPAE